jgi:hypothetical protein
MSSFKEKSQGFIIGIMVGLIVAGGFFILKLDDYFKELNFYKTVSNTFSKNSKDVDLVTVKSSNPVSTIKKEISRSTAIKIENSDEQNKTNAIADSSYLTKDSLTLENPNNDNLIVRKDELLSTKTIEVFKLDPVVKLTAKDSLLQKVSGIKEDRSLSKQFINIEFWSSPLNYKGYKMSKYKLVLYGISSAEGIKLYNLEDVIYLKSYSFIYRLDSFGDFKPYDRITDESIINKLK